MLLPGTVLSASFVVFFGMVILDEIRNPHTSVACYEMVTAARFDRLLWPAEMVALENMCYSAGRQAPASTVLTADEASALCRLVGGDSNPRDVVFSYCARAVAAASARANSTIAAAATIPIAEP